MLGHLQVYSSYSFQNSTILIEDLVKKASDLHYEALALTDKDNMYGAMELAKYAKKYGIKPIFGLEASVEDRKSTRLNSSHEIPSRMPSSA